MLLEAGCGVGNCIFPLLQEDRNIFVYACDFSPRAVEFVKVTVTVKSFVFLLVYFHLQLSVFSSSSQQHPLYKPERCCGFQCDLTSDDLRDHVPEGGVDVVTLIFVLSAVHPDKMKLVLQNVSRVRRRRDSSCCVGRECQVSCEDLKPVSVPGAEAWGPRPVQGLRPA